MSELRRVLLSGAEQIGLSLNEQQTDQLLDYLELMTKWNKTYKKKKNVINKISFKENCFIDLYLLI